MRRFLSILFLSTLSSHSARALPVHAVSIDEGGRPPMPEPYKTPEVPPEWKAALKEIEITFCGSLLQTGPQREAAKRFFEKDFSQAPPVVRQVFTALRYFDLKESLTDERKLYEDIKELQFHLKQFGLSKPNPSLAETFRKRAARSHSPSVQVVANSMAQFLEHKRPDEEKLLRALEQLVLPDLEDYHNTLCQLFPTRSQGFATSPLLTLRELLVALPLFQGGRLSKTAKSHLEHITRNDISGNHIFSLRKVLSPHFEALINDRFTDSERGSFSNEFTHALSEKLLSENIPHGVPTQFEVPPYVAGKIFGFKDDPFRGALIVPKRCGEGRDSFIFGHAKASSPEAIDPIPNMGSLHWDERLQASIFEYEVPPEHRNRYYVEYSLKLNCEGANSYFSIEHVMNPDKDPKDFISQSINIPYYKYTQNGTMVLWFSKKESPELIKQLEASGFRCEKDSIFPLKRMLIYLLANKEKPVDYLITPVEKIWRDTDLYELKKMGKLRHCKRGHEEVALLTEYETEDRGTDTLSRREMESALHRTKDAPLLWVDAVESLASYKIARALHEFHPKQIDLVAPETGNTEKAEVVSLSTLLALLNKKPLHEKDLSKDLPLLRSGNVENEERLIKELKNLKNSHYASRLSSSRFSVPEDPWLKTFEEGGEYIPGVYVNPNRSYSHEKTHPEWAALLNEVAHSDFTPELRLDQIRALSHYFRFMPPGVEKTRRARWLQAGLSLPKEAQRMDRRAFYANLSDPLTQLFVHTLEDEAAPILEKALLSANKGINVDALNFLTHKPSLAKDPHIQEALLLLLESEGDINGLVLPLLEDASKERLPEKSVFHESGLSFEEEHLSELRSYGLQWQEGEPTDKLIKELTQILPNAWAKEKELEDKPALSKIYGVGEELLEKADPNGKAFFKTIYHSPQHAELLRNAAWYQLARDGKRSLPPLVLQRFKEGKAEEFDGKLLRRASEKDIPAFIEILRAQKDDTVRAQILVTLSNLGEKALSAQPALEEILQENTKQKRNNIFVLTTLFNIAKKTSPPLAEQFSLLPKSEKELSIAGLLKFGNEGQKEKGLQKLRALGPSIFDNRSPFVAKLAKAISDSPDLQRQVSEMVFTRKGELEGYSSGRVELLKAMDPKVAIPVFKILLERGTNWQKEIALSTLYEKPDWATEMVPKLNSMAMEEKDLDLARLAAKVLFERVGLHR